MDNAKLYDREFYLWQREGSYRSAQHVVNIIKRYVMPESVLDIGCGVGTWLKAWQEAGVRKIQGMDANVMPDDVLLVPRDCIKIVDFEKSSLKSERFDLAMSLECLEHISEKRAQYVADVLLASSADILLFSAAIPMQRGINHINCRPLQYWVDFFKKKGFSCYDIIRPVCIEKALPVNPSYMQNALVFAKGTMARRLKDKGAEPIKKPVMFYHKCYVDKKMIHKKYPRWLIKTICCFVPKKSNRKRLMEYYAR